MAVPFVCALPAEPPQRYQPRNTIRSNRLGAEEKNDAGILYRMSIWLLSDHILDL